MGYRSVCTCLLLGSGAATWCCVQVGCAGLHSISTGDVSIPSGTGSGPPAPAPEAGMQRATLANAERAFVTQRRGDWCWAACCEMALRYNGIEDITQEMLVERIKGEADDQRAIDTEILVALSTDRTSRTERSAVMPKSLRVDTKSLFDGIWKGAKIYTSRDGAIEDFRRGQPTLLFLENWEGAPGHIVFITEIEYRDRRGNAAEIPVVGGIVKWGQDTADKLIGDYRYEVRTITFFDPMQGAGLTTIDGEKLEAHQRGYLSRRQAQEIMSDVGGTIKLW